MSVSAQQQQYYQEMRIQTADRKELLLLVYEAALRALHRARRACKTGAESKARGELMTAMAAVHELNRTLNMEAGAIAESLRSLYVYVLRMIADAAPDLKAEPLDEAIRIIGSLYETWQEAFAKMVE